MLPAPLQLEQVAEPRVVLVDVDLGRRGHSKALTLIQGPLSAGARPVAAVRRDHNRGHVHNQRPLGAVVSLGDLAGTWESV